MTVDVAVKSFGRPLRAVADEEASRALARRPSRMGKGGRSILADLSGEFRSGSITGLMGPSGSGKTSLLNVLMQRTADMGRCAVAGSVQLNGKPLPDWFSSVIGYVPQVLRPPSAYPPSCTDEAAAAEAGTHDISLTCSVFPPPPLQLQRGVFHF